MSEKMVYVGKIIGIETILGADFIVGATVVCGPGGKWRGIVKKDQFQLGERCLVYCPDALVPESSEMEFMKASGWRVKMRRFRGAPSEVVVMPCPDEWFEQCGDDVTEKLGVTKYHKPVPACLNGKIEGVFPGFVPKTDEPNYQNEEGQNGISWLRGKPYYVTEKCDGSSTTAFRYKGRFGVCSRNWELKKSETNGYWKMALKYKLEDLLPEGYALQWETCGPGIQSNPMGLTEISAFAFSGYKIDEHRYLEMDEFLYLCKDLGFPVAKVIIMKREFDPYGVEFLGQGLYANKKPREGVVVRSQENILGGKPVSFKVINLDYEK